jgi:hypothetical protein
MSSFDQSDWILFYILCAILACAILITIMSVWRHLMSRHLDERILATLDRIERILGKVYRAVQPHEPTSFGISQIGENAMPTNFSIVAGTSGDFVATPVPTGSAPLSTQPVPQWVASDSAVVLTPTTNGLGVNAAVPATDTGTSFTLAISYTRSDGTTATGSATITITPATPPSNEPTSFTITQND